MGNLQLTSSAFSHGEEIPRKYGYKNGNEAPPLAINGIPEETKSLTLIMDDPDAMGAVGKVWVHWVVWNIDPITKDLENFTADLREDSVIPPSLSGSWTTEGMTDFGEVGYGGPAPPDKTHTYIFKLYALDCKLELAGESTKADVEKAMDGHILEETTLKGTYAP